MFERDYIKRLIQQFAEVVEKIVLFKKRQDWQQVQMVIDVSAKQLLGLNPDLIDNMDSSSLTSMFQISDETDFEKCYILGRLLMEQAFIYENTKTDEHKVYKTYQKSFDLLIKALEGNEIRNKENIQAVVNCCDSLLQYKLDDNSLIKIYNFYKNEAFFADAENIVLLLLKEKTAGSRELARNYYNELLLLSDADLEKGNLPRDEVLEGLEKLNIINEVNH